VLYILLLEVAVALSRWVFFFSRRVFFFMLTAPE
jgi:hypothetical protein